MSGWWSNVAGRVAAGLIVLTVARVAYWIGFGP